MKKTAWLLIFATLLSCFSLLCYAEHSDSVPLQPQSEYSLDFSLPYAPRVCISPSDLLSKILEGRESLSSAEKEYLDGYFDEYLVYASALPDSLVDTVTDAGTLSVSAESYTYTAENGIEVTFIPVYCTVGDARYDLADGKADGIAYTEGAEVKVYYNGHLPLPESTVNKLLNFTYNEAQLALSSAEYIIEYNKALAEYNKYTEDAEKYEKDKKSYENYLSAKELYDKAIVLYEENRKYAETYQAKLKEYTDYVKANEKYLSDLEQYKKDYAAYEKNYADYTAYIYNANAIRVAITPLDTIYNPSGEEMGSLYGAMQNNELVSMFEKYKSTLVNSFGVKESDISLIRRYSDELDLLLTQYKEKKNISDKDAFEFYKANYQRISFLFGAIYGKLTSIITPTIFNLICGKMELEYKEDNGAYRKLRLKNVLASTYLISCALNDSVTADSVWHFYADDGEPHTYFFSDLLSVNAIITDTNKSNPAELIWCEPVELMEKAPELPVRPKKVEKPMEPLDLPKPTEPKKVEKPIPPTPVQKPEFKEEYNTEVIHRAGDILLLLEDKSSPLTLREEITEPTYYDVEIPVCVDLFDGSTPTVTVYGRNGEIQTRLGDLSALSELNTDGYSDSHYTYTFYGWSLSPTENIPLPDALDESISVYRLYTAEKRTYSITFSVDGTETVIPVKAGELPSYVGIQTEKESDSLYDYTFQYFYPPIRRADRDATYTAQYSSSDRIYTVTFKYGNEITVRRYVAGSTVTEGYPTPFSSYMDKDTFYEFVRWDKPLSSVTEDTVYTAIYNPTLLASAENSDITVTDTPSGYLLSGADSLYTLDGLLMLAASSQKSITVLFKNGEATLTLTPAAALYLYSHGAKNAILSEDTNGTAICFTTASGHTVTPNGGMRLRTPHGFEDGEDIYVSATYRNNVKEENIPCTVSDKYVEFSVTADAYYKAEKKYSLTLSDSEFGSIISDKTLFGEGDRVSLYLYSNSGYTLDSLTLVNDKTGEETSIGKQSSFEMPAYSATVKASFVPVEYKITFVYHNSTHTVYCKLGEMPTVPDIPKSFNENGMFYSFIGWSSTVSMATEDITYTAKYYSIKESDIVVNNRTALEAIRQKYIIPIIIVFICFVALICGSVILIRKRKKAKKNGKKKKKISKGQ